MSYRTQPARSAPKHGRQGTEYIAAVQAVRDRAAAGEPCYFWADPRCPHHPPTGHYSDAGRFDLDLPHQHRNAFTAHHLNRLMDGGQPVPDPTHMAPAHRGCNSRDGLTAQNARRQGLDYPPAQPPHQPSPRSQEW